MTLRRDRARCILAVVLAFAAAAAAGTPSWPSVPLPPDSAGERVTRHMKNNGLDMRASKFGTTHSLDQVVAFYRDKWPGTHVVNKLGNKTIVGHAEDGFYVTVTLEEKGGGTEGSIGTMVMPKEKVEYEMGGGFDKPADTEVFNDIRYLDGPGETRTLGMSNALSPFQNYEYYRQRLHGQGWKLQQGKKCVMPSRTCVALYERGKEKIAMTMNRDASKMTQIVVTID